MFEFLGMKQETLVVKLGISFVYGGEDVKDENGEVLFGTHVGTNSSNQFLLEVKGQGNIVVKDPKELEEVLPYTFSVDVAGKEIHYQGKPGTLEKGDLLLIPGNGSFVIAQVKAVDTRNKGARANFKGRKLLTEKV